MHVHLGADGGKKWLIFLNVSFKYKYIVKKKVTKYKNIKKKEHQKHQSDSFWSTTFLLKDMNATSEKRLLKYQLLWSEWNSYETSEA